MQSMHYTPNYSLTATETKEQAQKWLSRAGQNEVISLWQSRRLGDGLFQIRVPPTPPPQIVRTHTAHWTRYVLSGLLVR